MSKLFKVAAAALTLAATGYGAYKLYEKYCGAKVAKQNKFRNQLEDIGYNFEEEDEYLVDDDVYYFGQDNKSVVKENNFIEVIEQESDEEFADTEPEIVFEHVSSIEPEEDVSEEIESVIPEEAPVEEEVLPELEEVSPEEIAFEESFENEATYDDTPAEEIPQELPEEESEQSLFDAVYPITSDEDSETTYEQSSIITVKSEPKTTYEEELKITVKEEPKITFEGKPIEMFEQFNGGNAVAYEDESEPVEVEIVEGSEDDDMLDEEELPAQPINETVLDDLYGSSAE